MQDDEQAAVPPTYGMPDILDRNMLATVLDQLGEGVIVADAAGTIIYVNAAAERLHGMAHLGVPPQDYSTTYNLFTEQGEPYPSQDLPLARAVQHAETVTEARWRIRRPDGTEVLVIGSARPLRAADGSAQGAVLTLRDETARQKTEDALRANEERFRFLDRLNEATTHASASREIMAATATMLGAQMGVARCAYADVEENGSRFTIRDDWTAGVSSSVGDYDLDLFGTRAAADMRAGRTLVIENVDTELDAGNGSSMFNAIGVKAIICCPLVKHGRLVAMMAVHHAAPRRWNADEVALLNAVVERSWAHIERVRAEEALRASEAQFRTMVESIPQLAWMAEPNGDIFWYNRRWYAYTGTTLEQMRGWGWRAVHHPDHVDRVTREVQAKWAAGVAWEGMYLLRSAAGEWRWFLTRAEPIRNEAGELVRWFGTNTDVTAQRAAEEVLARSREELERLVEERTAALIHEVDERRKTEEALRQSEKLQALGQLTGGIAHDFANLLQVVHSGVELLRRGKEGPVERRAMFPRFHGSGRRARQGTDRPATDFLPPAGTQAAGLRS